jgi:hypothetical protein
MIIDLQLDSKLFSTLRRPGKSFKQIKMKNERRKKV